MDLLRGILKGRCAVCDHVVSSDDKAVREIMLKCSKANCGCAKVMGKMVHPVCNWCYDMWHALYLNYCMKDLNYFKRWDEIDEKKDDEGRKRMGL